MISSSVSTPVADPTPGLAAPAGTGEWIDWFADASVAVIDLALACCAIESEFAVPLAGQRRHDAIPDATPVVMVVSGTLTDALAPSVAALIGVHPEAHVVAFGSCACAGGPYWDSYSVTKGVDQWVPVATYIPGCPPPPQALIEVVDAVRTGFDAA